GVLRSTSEIRSLRAVESRTGIPVELEGTVVAHAPRMGRLVVQDQSGGIGIDVSTTALSVEPGQRVRVKGVTAPGDPVPVVIRPHVEVLHYDGLPEPI